MSEHNIEHEKTKEELLKYILTLHARMEEVQARVSGLRSLHRAVDFPQDDLEKGEEELSSVIAELDAKRGIDWTRKLPDELLMNIVRFLDAKYLYKLRDVDTRWADLMKQPPMLKLERALRWTGNNAKHLKVEVIMPDMLIPTTAYEGGIVHDGGKVYVYVMNIGGRDTKQILSHDGTVAIVDPNMTGVFTVHEGAVYYAVTMEEEGQMNPDRNLVVKYREGKSNVISESYYNIVKHIVVHKEHLWINTNFTMCVLDRNSLTHVCTSANNALSKLISCRDYLVGFNGSLMTFTCRDGAVVKSTRSLLRLSLEMSQRRPGGAIVDIAATEKGELCLFVERSTGYTTQSFVVHVKDNGEKQFFTPVITTGRLHRYWPGMGVTGEHVYVNTSSGHFCIVNLKTTQTTFVKMKSLVSRVILTPNHDVFGFLTREDRIRIIRLYWDGK